MRQAYGIFTEKIQKQIENEGHILKLWYLNIFICTTKTVKPNYDLTVFIMTTEYRNAEERFDKPILSAFAKSNKQLFEFALYSLQ